MFPQSPDLNSIEYMLGSLDNKVSVQFPPPCTLSELRNSPERGKHANSDELCLRPLFVNPTSTISCHSGQR
ncbi:hypothetical protein TNCV_967471 [Trichonephila clavipes]|nr:hypothetical protein TNCV_967471 [Trichonephila clavipes]